MPEFFTVLMSTACSAFASSALLSLRRLAAPAAAVAWIGLVLTCAAGLMAWLEVQRLPVYGLFETSLHLALILACLVEGLTRTGHLRLIRPWGRFLTAGLLGAALLAPVRFNPDFYMYQVLQVQLFFFLRLTAAGILLFAGLVYVSSCFRPDGEQSGDRTQARLNTAERFLVLAALVFLSSEFSGTLWCLQGWGDTWHWSSGFFKSTSLFLILMLPLHAPSWLRSTPLRKALFGIACSGIVCIGIVVPL